MWNESLRIQQLRLSIREGEMRLSTAKPVQRYAIARSVRNAQIRINRLLSGMDEGHMIFENGQWRYEHEAEIDK